MPRYVPKQNLKPLLKKFKELNEGEVIAIIESDHAKLIAFRQAVYNMKRNLKLNDMQYVTVRNTFYIRKESSSSTRN